ncbi:MAG: hypothetical protein QE285_04480 [Aquabacterium sp.]|nr:hypothetical protein [Aquabacterium sp.]
MQLVRGQAQIDGQPLLNGRNMVDLEGAALRNARRTVQIIFQNPIASLNLRMRAAEILDAGLTALKPDTAPSDRGQRIAIARALAVSPRLIVCDEPTSALDVSVQAQILNLLRELQRELGVSYPFITHNIAVVEYIADFEAVMRAGRIV